MPRLHLFNWTIFVFWALIAPVLGFGTALISSLYQGAAYSIRDALGETLRYFSIGAGLVFIMRYFARTKQRGARNSANSKPGQSGDLAEL
jgi:hypothetical protein